MGNYTIFQMFENPRRGNSRSQIVFRTDIFRKLTLDAPVSVKKTALIGANVHILATLYQALHPVLERLFCDLKKSRTHYYLRLEKNEIRYRSKLTSAALGLLASPALVTRLCASVNLQAAEKDKLLVNRVGNYQCFDTLRPEVDRKLE